MYTEDAITLAIKGGYGYQGFTPGTGDYYSHVNTLNTGDTFLDPLFWQALGKAEGWKHGYDLEPAKHNGSNYLNWLSHWHSFIDALAEGKDAEDFFKSILSKQ